MRQRPALLIQTASAALLVAATASAQERASVNGLVQDASSGVLPGVTVEVSSPVLIERLRSVVTDSSGRYAVIDLRPGTYAVTFSLPGFRTVRREGIVLEGAFAATVNAMMEVGAVEETITVTGASPVVDVQGTQTQFVANKQVLEALASARTSPSQPYGAAVLVPGVALYRPQGGLNVMTVHGSANGDQRITFEGMNIGQLLLAGGGQTSGVGVNDLSSTEVVFNSGTQSAESSTAGVQMDAIPKEGGNVLSGTWRVYGSKGALQNDNITPELSRFIRQGDRLDFEWDTNTAVGGPLLQNKLWWFGAYRFQDSNTLVSNTYFPDGRQAGTGGPTTKHLTARLTYQLSQRNKLRVSYYRQATNTERNGVGAGVQPEAALRLPVPMNYAAQAKWLSPVTNRLLLEFGQSFNLPQYVFEYQKANGPLDVQHHYLPANTRTVATSITPTYYVSPTYYTVGTVSYVTGTHTLKIGGFFEKGYQTARYSFHGDMAVLTYLNDRPSTIGVRNTPISRRDNLNAAVGLFAQDKWTIERLTFTGGIRFDYFNASVPAQSATGGRFVPAFDTAAVSCLPCWKQWEPRLGASYDLFGSGKTAVKATVGKFLRAQALGLAETVNPMQLQSETRSWNDLDGNGSALDAFGTAQYEEIGPKRNANFGLPSGATRFDQNTPWPHNWEQSLSVQHELRSGMSVTVAYYRRQFYNMLMYRNTAIDTNTDFTPFTIVAPRHPQLPDGGGEVITMYNLNANKLGAVSNILTYSTKNTRKYNGIELSVNARLPRGGFAFGGMTMERTATNNCDGPVTTTQSATLSTAGISDPNVLRFCNQVMPFRALWKASAASPLAYGVQISASFQARPGTSQAANYTINSATAGIAITGGGTLTVDLVDPTTRFYDYVSQLDLRVGRLFRVGRTRLQGFVDVFNVLNASTVLTVNQTFSTTNWLDPQIILQGRRAQMGMQLDF